MHAPFVRGGEAARLDMRSDFFDYDLPPHLIAQEPCAERDHSRLLVVNRAAGSLRHHVFHELPDLLNRGDLLVLNDTRVVPARLLGHRAGRAAAGKGCFCGRLPLAIGRCCARRAADCERVKRSWWSPVRCG